MIELTSQWTNTRSVICLLAYAIQRQKHIQYKIQYMTTNICSIIELGPSSFDTVDRHVGWPTRLRASRNWSLGPNRLVDRNPVLTAITTATILCQNEGWHLLGRDNSRRYIGSAKDHLDSLHFETVEVELHNMVRMVLGFQHGQFCFWFLE